MSSLADAELLAYQQAARQGRDIQSDLSAFFDWYFKTWKQYVLDPRVAAAGESCAAGRLALDTITGFERQSELFGFAHSLDVNIGDLLPKVAGVCIQEEYELCRDQHIIHRIIPAILGLMRQGELLGMHGSDQNTGGAASSLDQVEAHAWDLARKCLTFELQFNSTAKMGTGDGSFTSSVELTVQIELDTSAIELDSYGRLVNGLKGTASLDNTDYEFKPNLCSADGITGGGTFQVKSLTWEDAPPSDGRPYGHVTAIHLTYDPGKTSELAKVTCPGAQPVTVPPSPMWTLAFEALHMDEMSGTSGSGPAPTVPDLGSLLGGAGIPNIPGLPGTSNLPGSSGQTQPGGEEGRLREWHDFHDNRMGRARRGTVCSEGMADVGQYDDHRNRRRVFQAVSQTSIMAPPLVAGSG